MERYRKKDELKCILRKTFEVCNFGWVEHLKLIFASNPCDWKGMLSLTFQSNSCLWRFRFLPSLSVSFLLTGPSILSALSHWYFYHCNMRIREKEQFLKRDVCSGMDVFTRSVSNSIFPISCTRSLLTFLLSKAEMYHCLVSPLLTLSLFPFPIFSVG